MHSDGFGSGPQLQRREDQSRNVCLCRFACQLTQVVLVLAIAATACDTAWIVFFSGVPFGAAWPPPPLPLLHDHRDSNYSGHLGATARTMQQRSDSKSGLRYWLHLPPAHTAEAKWPLLLFLHGAGESGRALENLLSEGVPRRGRCCHSR